MPHGWVLDRRMSRYYFVTSHHTCAVFILLLVIVILLQVVAATGITVDEYILNEEVGLEVDTCTLIEVSLPYLTYRDSIHAHSMTMKNSFVFILVLLSMSDVFGLDQYIEDADRFPGWKGTLPKSLNVEIQNSVGFGEQGKVLLS